jgi:ubiquitin-protein ligase
MSKRRAAWTTSQRHALEELRALRRDHPDRVLEISDPYRSDRNPSDLTVQVRLSMAVIDRPAHDTLLEESETVTLAVGLAYPERPPKVYVDHDRFVDIVHVLYGRLLCIYLNEDREWHPAGGITDALEQVWKLLEDAANNRFDPKTALFHPVGGLNPATPGTGAAVVRAFPGIPGKPLSVASARWRTEGRIDVGPAGAFCGPASMRALTVTVPGRLPFGPGDNLGRVLDNITAADGPARATVLGALQRTASSIGPGLPVVLTLAVARGTNAEDGWHLCTARFSLGASALRLVVGATSSAEIEAAFNPGTRMEWFSMSDQRDELAVRRDARRPANAFEGLHVEVWGCGALGSWIAEILVRAGVARITLVDRRGIEAGLLVRQNYVEEDVGLPKASQLKVRLEAISDLVEVEPVVDTAARPSKRTCHLVVDATVNEAVAALATPPPPGTVVAAVATDVESASLGLLVVGSSEHTPAEVQDVLSSEVLSRGDLEPFHRFWNDPDPDDMVLPAPGCSTPTFHGSAADAMGLASSMVNLLGVHLLADVPGLHLINMPHSGIDLPGRIFLEMAS